MRNTRLYLLAATAVVAGILLTIPASAANPAKPAKPAAKAAAKTGPKEYGGAMPLPVDQRIEKQNSPEDKLVVEITHSAVIGGDHVAYVKIVWGDLDNLIKKDGKQFYSNWDGSLKLDPDATGAIDEKIQFDDGTKKAATKPVAAKPVTAKPVAVKPKAPAEPHAGSGRDEVEVKAGADVTWEAGVVGALDGLRIKITSPDANISGTITAGKFTIPFTITGGAGGVTTTPPGISSVREVPVPKVSSLRQP